MASKCPSCEGLGSFDKWGKPCAAGSMHRSMTCEVCDGSQVVMGTLVKCEDCKGLGGINTFKKPCKTNDMHFVSKCPLCKGGYKQPCHVPQPAAPFPPMPQMPQMPMPTPHLPTPTPTPTPHLISVGGTWSESPPSHHSMQMSQAGNNVTVSCPTQPWSSATGVISGNTITFGGGLAGLTATYDVMSQKLNFSNGCSWVLGGHHQPSAVPPPVDVRFECHGPCGAGPGMAGPPPDLFGAMAGAMNAAVNAANHTAHAMGGFAHNVNGRPQ